MPTPSEGFPEGVAELRVRNLARWCPRGWSSLTLWFLGDSSLSRLSRCSSRRELGSCDALKRQLPRLGEGEGLQCSGIPSNGLSSSPQAIQTCVLHAESYRRM